MVGTLQPLDKKFAIVDRNGNPTDYFVRWAQQKQIDITGSIALSDLVAYLDAHQLIAGVGIQFAPGPNGDLNQSPTIHADVQAILDEISATRGIILYRGIGGWAALLPGTAGNVLQTNGAGADPTWVPPSGGGGQHEYEGFGNLLSLAGLTLLAGASANLTLTNGSIGHQYLWTASGANTVQMAYMAAPATPWNVYLRMEPETEFAANVQFGLVLRNSTTGKLTTFTFNSNTTTSIQEWTNPTTFSSTQLTLTTSWRPRFWFRINNDGTNLNFYRSVNGTDWVLLATRTLAAFMSSVDQIGLGGVPQVAGSVRVSNFGVITPT